MCNAVKSLGVPKPVGLSQLIPTSRLAAIGSSSARFLKAGSIQALATKRDAGAGPIPSANSVYRRWSVVDQFSERDVLLFHEDPDNRPQPTTVVREPVVHRCRHCQSSSALLRSRFLSSRGPHSQRRC